MANLPADSGWRPAQDTPHRARVRGWRWLVPLAVLFGLLLPGAPALAQETLAEIDAEIEKAWRELEPLIEEYNGVRSELKKNREASDELAEKIEPLELHATVARNEIADIAVDQYKAGPMSSFGALVTSGSPTTFVDRLAALDMLARRQQDRIGAASEVLAAYEAEKAELDALIETQEEQEADLAKRADAIEEDLEELEKLRDEVEQQQQQTQESTAPQTTTGGEPTGSCPAESGSGPGMTAAEFACAQIGKPYQWGASGPGSYDCSGLTQASWGAAGVSLSHHTGAQWNEGAVVDRANLVPGDLVFYYGDLSHVGIYVGNGMIVDAPSAGDSVRMRGIDTMPVSGIRRPG
jgi:peptidoglycan DL-endopeptidase CwlO